MNNLKKIVSAFVTCIMLLPGISGKADFKSSNDSVVTTHKVNVYDWDSLDGRIIGTIDVNEDLYRFISGDNLDLINYNNHLGFIEKNGIRSVSFSSDDTQYKKISELGYTTKEVNLRSYPDINSKVIQVLKAGEVVDGIAITNTGWALVRYQDTIGFISSNYINKLDFNNLEEQINNLPQVKKMVIALKDVNVRYEPNTNSETYGVLKSGKMLTSLGSYDSEWLMVTNGTDIGYVSKKYAKEKIIIDGVCYKHVYMCDDTNGYNNPFGEVAGIIPKYEVGFVYGETDFHYLVEIEGKVGFVKKSDVKVLDGKHVIVDISSQKMYLYDNLDLVLSSDIVSGKNTTPTDLGVYKIYSKEVNKTLIGPDYESFVKYWMPFNGGEGLHDASWRHKFGGSIYEKKGSHGCVNLPEKIAAEVYDNVRVGTKVIVKK